MNTTYSGTYHDEYYIQQWYLPRKEKSCLMVLQHLFRWSNNKYLVVDVLVAHMHTRRNIRTISRGEYTSKDDFVSLRFECSK